MKLVAVPALFRMSLLRRIAGRAWMAIGASALAFLVSSGFPLQAQTLVQLGQTAYNAANPLGLTGGAPQACSSSGCHFAAVANPPTNGQPGSNHHLAANHVQQIRDAFATGGLMTAQFGTDPVDSPTNAQLDIMFKLSLHIGQFKQPAFVASPNLGMAVRSGVSATKNIFPQLMSDGTGGVANDAGFTRTINTANTLSASVSQDGVNNGPAAVSTMAYNMTYRSVAGFTGSDNFGISIGNLFGAATATVPVVVYGITSGATASGSKNIAYNNTTSPALHTIATNDPAATFSVTVDPPSGPGGQTLASLGLSLGTVTTTGAGRTVPIIGSFGGEPGVYTLHVTANISGSTVINPGPVTKDVTLTMAGITSGNPPGSIPQNAGTPVAYQITASPTPASNFTLVAVPTGSGVLPFTVDAGTGAVTITPSIPGNFSFTMGATTSAPAAFTVSKLLSVTVSSATAPVISSALPARPAPAGTVGQPINAPTGYQIVASTATDPGSFSLQLLDTDPSTAPASRPTLAQLGLAVDANTGFITGAPLLSGDFVLQMGATNAGGAGVGTLVRTIRINPNSAPVITSGDPAASNVNAAFSYAIVANGGPITSYAVVAPSALPTGLSLNTGTGVITGTPTVSGVFKAKVSATNIVALTSVAKELTFTINPTTTPAIVAPTPTFVTVPAGLAITPIQIVATNPTILGYAANGLPPGLQLDTATGVISGTPTTPSAAGTPFSVNITATNAAGATTPAFVMKVTVGVPAPLACAMTVPLNTPPTLDLASCLFNGFSPTGVSILATPSHGGAQANGTRVTYTPVNNYFGSDSFTFVGSGLGGISPQGTVTVTITGRPDPTQDAVVTALVAAQTETAQRFSRAQISNFQRRMESLHRSGSGTSGAQGATLQQQAPLSGAGTGGALSAAATLTSPAGPGAVGLVAPANSGSGYSSASVQASQGADAVFRTNQRPTEISQAEAVNAIASGLGVSAMPFADSVFSLVKSRSVNLAGVASGMGLNAPTGNTGGMSYWVEGVASFGTRDASGGVVGSEFSSNGISIGADRRLSDQLAVGMGLGYARDTATIGTDGSRNRSKGYSLAVYGSYQPSDNTFVDAMLGFGSLDFDSTRYVAPINDFAYGQRGGTQVFGSLTGGYEFRDQALLVSPYGRLDFSYDRLRSSTETGAGAYALTYFGQKSTSVQGALGVRAETVQTTGFGYAVPRVRAEFRHEFEGTGQAFIGYADQPGGPRYALSSSGSGRNSLVLGIGSDFLMRDGLTLSLEYQLSHSFSNDSSYALRVRLSKEFDAQGLPKLLGTYTARTGRPMDVQVDAAYTTDSNVTRAKSGPDKLNDDLYSVNASKTFVSPLSEQSRLIWTGSLGGEKFHRFNGLSRFIGSAEAEYQYRESSDFNDPTFGGFAKLTGEAYETSLRDGYRFSAGVSLRQPLTDRMGLFLALSHNRRYADSDVFSTRDNALRANVDYEINDNQTLYFGTEYRRGDITSSGRASLENASIAKVFAQDDAYPGRQFFAYRFDGSTVLTTVGYNLALGARDSLDFSWRYVRSTPGLRPSFVTSPKSYKASQLSAVYLMRF